jgi:hypothetical protein
MIGGGERRRYRGFVTADGRRPLLFLDVDGTLLSTVGVQLPSTLEDWDAAWQNASNPHLATIVPEHGPRLLAMPCDLIWATAWMADANLVIGPILGLPELPVADLGELPGIDDPVRPEHDKAASLSWKTRGLVELAAGRPFVWIDDEITDADRGWVGAHHRGEALLHRVDPRCGLTDADLTIVEKWLQAI